jgi:hypothetical protein
MTKLPETPQDRFLSLIALAKREKVRLTPEIEKEIRDHLAEAQARAERGEPMTQEMIEFMENVRLWVGMPEEWREKLRTVEAMANSPEFHEAQKRHISIRQWLDLLHVAGANKEKAQKGNTITEDINWIDETFRFPGRGVIKAKESLSIIDHEKLTRLPDGLVVEKGLHLGGCTGLKSLPEDLRVGSYLNLGGCTGLVKLPERITVGGTLCLTNCTGLKSLPEGLGVGIDLWLNGCTGLTKLPEGLRAGRDLFLSKNLNEQVKQDAERLKKEGQIGGEIKYF